MDLTSDSPLASRLYVVVAGVPLAGQVEILHSLQHGIQIIGEVDVVVLQDKQDSVVGYVFQAGGHTGRLGICPRLPLPRGPYVYHVDTVPSPGYPRRRDTVVDYYPRKGPLVGLGVEVLAE